MNKNFIYWVLLLVGCDSGYISTYFNTYQDLVKGERFITWIPSYYPTGAKNISIITDVEIDYFHSTFSLTEQDSKDFRVFMDQHGKRLKDEDLSSYGNHNYWCIKEEGKGINSSWMIVHQLDRKNYELSSISKKSYEDRCSFVL